MAFKIPDTPEELFGQKGPNLPNFTPNGPLIVGLAIFLVVIAFAMTSFYMAGPDEVGIVQRFGRYVRTTPSGLHLKMPLGIETVKKVKVTKNYKEEFGFQTVQSGVKTQYSQKNFEDESLMLTGDINVLDVDWVVQFRIMDPVKALFNIRQPSATVRDLSHAVMRLSVGDRSVNDVLTKKRTEIEQDVKVKLQKILDHYESGIVIEDVKLRNVNAPKEVQPSFNVVNEAEAERDKVINQAKEAYNKAIPKARGQAEQLIREAEGYALAVVNKANGDASRFMDVWSAYKTAKDVTRRRMYLDMLADIVPEAGKVYITDPNSQSILPLLNLGDR